ncbi:tetratricopeptide repeat protein [Helicobacter sp. T3_23-1056]
MKKKIIACVVLAVLSAGMAAIYIDEIRSFIGNCGEDRDGTLLIRWYFDNISCNKESFGNPCNKDECKSIGQFYAGDLAINIKTTNNINMGNFLIEKRDLKKAICYFERAVALGDSSAYHLLEQSYMSLKDYKKAISYYEKLIASGDNRGYDSLARVYHLGLGDYVNAKKYYEIVCDKVSDSQSNSCFQLAAMYADELNIYNGVVRRDYHKAAELYKKVCNMKEKSFETMYACNRLGVLYRDGKGVAQNLSIAKQFFGKACDLACDFGFISFLGCDNYKDLNEAGVK